MKIKRLFVPEYKNVTVDLELHADLITLLVGQNGMGKSNLLEVLLLIFDELNQLAGNRKQSEKLDFHYTLDYECRGRYFSINKMTEEYSFLEYFFRDDGGADALPTDIHHMELPNQIIGYYSGENKRVRTLVDKHIKREESSRRRRYSKGREGTLEPKKLFFAENRHSMLVLTTLLLYQEHSQYGGNIKKVLKDVVNIGEWDRIHMRFRNPSFAKMSILREKGKTLEDYHDRLIQGEDVGDAHIFWGVKGDVDKLLRLLLSYSYNYSMKYSFPTSSRGTVEFFDIESIPSDNEFRDLLFNEFPTPMDFLNTLEECYVLNMVDKLDIVLRKTGEKTFYPYVQLSEGEQQYLTVMGLIALSHGRNDETLFLLDEPDTHINPQWQRNYIKHIMDLSMTQADKKSKAFFISTHSPLLVQANSSNDKEVNLLLFKRDENRKVQIDTEEDVVENWRIDQVLMSKYFDLPSSRPASLDKFMERRRAMVEGGAENGVKNSLASDVDEFGYLPTGETMADVEAMAYIHTIAEKLRKEGHL